MKINKLTNGLLVSLVLSASVVEADSKYPATDFQPKVVYQDSDYKHADSAPEAVSDSKGQVSVADPNYPAANFQPEVLYQDTDYKHQQDSVKSASAKSVSKSTDAVAMVEKTSSSEGVATNDGSMMDIILAVIVLGVVGFVVKNKSSGKSTPTVKTSVVRREEKVVDDSVSGVAKYLASKVGSEPTGVAKYLNDRDSSPSSSVQKYVAKKKVSARLASVTGVEKYLKNRG